MKPMKTTYIEYTVGAHFALALEYGYDEDMSASEARALAQWEASLAEKYTDLDGRQYEFMHTAVCGDEDEFGVCDITDMRGRTVTVHAVYRLSLEDVA